MCLDEERSRHEEEEEEDFTSFLPIIKSTSKETSQSISAYNKAACSLNRQTQRDESRSRRKKYFWNNLCANVPFSLKVKYSAATLAVSCAVLLILVLNIFWYTGNLSLSTKQASEVWQFLNNGDIVNLTTALVSIYNGTLSQNNKASTQLDAPTTVTPQLAPSKPDAEQQGPDNKVLTEQQGPDNKVLTEYEEEGEEEYNYDYPEYPTLEPSVNYSTDAAAPGKEYPNYSS